MLSASAHASISTPTIPAATYCAALLVLVWLAVMAKLLWHFETQRLAESQQLMHFDARALPAPPAAQGIAKAIYFVDPQCRCTATAVAEIRRLQRGRLQRDRAAPLAQFIYAPAAINGIDAQPLTVAELTRWRHFVPATPAVAVWNARDQLIYFGPIKAAGLCIGSGDSKSFLQIALQSIRQQSKQPAINQLQARDTAFKTWDVVACACPASAQS